MTEPRLTASIRINLAGILAGLQRTLQGLTNLVAFGLQASQRFTTDQLALPDVAFHLRLSTRADLWEKSRVRSNFQSWILASGLRDAVEAFASVLEEARIVCAAWTLSNSSGHVSIPEWNERLGDEGRHFHSLGLPRRVDFLHCKYGVALPEDKEKDIRSLNRARNCLVHRAGVVTLRDLDAPESRAQDAISIWRASHATDPWTNEQSKAALRAQGIEPALVVSWLKLQPFAELDDVRTPLDPREQPYVPAGSTIGMEVTRETRAFELDTRVSFTSNDFAEIGFAFFNAAQTLVQALEAKGRGLGVDFTEQSDA
jgi:hypothetical protein